MDLQGNLLLNLLTVLLSCRFLILECRKMDGYKFPVYSTDFCPRNETEWNKRSSLFNCTGEDSTYACFPNDDITQLIEFCYPLQIIAIPPDLCLFLSKEGSKMEAYDCRTTFTYGCPERPYRGSTIYKWYGCFLAEPFCESAPKSSTQETTVLGPKPDNISYNSTAQQRKLTSILVWTAILPGLCIPPCILGCLIVVLFLKRKKKLNGRKVDEEERNGQEKIPLLSDQRNIPPEKENPFEIDIFENWRHEDEMFVPTRASEKVESLIKTKNLVIVAGHSGYGKTAIVQHIALKYRKHGWVVQPVDEVQEIKVAYMSGKFIKNKTIFVLNDPIGRESLNDILYTTWKKYEQTLTCFLQNVKLIITCRTCIVFDTRVRGLFQDKSNIVVVDDINNKLNHFEKRALLKKYTESEEISEENTIKILENEICFPLLCKMFASNRKHFKDVLQFFMEPIDVLKEEIEICKISDIEKYCGLVCLVLFNNKLFQNDLHKKKNIFKKCLDLCGIQKRLPPATIMKNLELLEGFFTKKKCDFYQFYHDFVMEVTTFVFGTDFPKEMLRYADTGFILRRVRLESSSESYDPLIITLSDAHINDLVNRLSEDICKDRFLEVVLNPCLKNEKITDLIIKRMQKNPKTLKWILRPKTLESIEREADSMWRDNWFSRLDFLNLFHEITPLFALIVFRHDKLASFFLEALKKEKEMSLDNSIFSAIFCNGSKDIYDFFPERKVTECLTESRSSLHPIHIASIFHNYTLLSEIVKQNVDVNMSTNDKYAWTPLTLAGVNKVEDSPGQPSLTPRDETFRILLDNGANINKCTNNGISPLFIACQNGFESSVELLLNEGAEVNRCTENGTSPLFISCQNGHDKMVELLLKRGAVLNSSEEKGPCPLFTACRNGHVKTVALLMNNGVDINLCNETGASALHIACEYGHEETVKLLLDSGADTSLCTAKGNSPLNFACQNGHDKIVQLLLKCSVDVNLCNKTGASALYKACGHGHNRTVQILLENDADISLCTKNGNSPLFIACQNGFDNIVQLLLKHGAEVNFLNKTLTSPLYIACKHGHNGTVQSLLENDADISLCTKTGNSPLFIACQNGFDNIVQLLLIHGAEVNILNKTLTSPLYKACEHGHNSTVQFLLENNADISLCTKTGNSPLFIACQNGFDNIVQLLLIHGAEVNILNKTLTSPLHIASESGHVNTVRLLLKNGAKASLSTEMGYCPLHAACINGHDGIVELLLEFNADVNCSSENGDTPLHIACQNGYDSIVQVLLTNGAEVELSNKSGSTPSQMAYENGHDTIVLHLLKHEANVDKCTNAGTCPLFLACQKGYSRITKLLIENNANVNLCNSRGASPLYIACQNGHDTTAKLLLENDAKVNLCDNAKISPLYIACKNGHHNTVQILLNHGADANLCKENWNSPLYIACHKGCYDIVQLLLNFNANVNRKKKDGASPLYAACEKGHKEIVQLLLNHSADVNLRNNTGASPLYIACLNKHHSTVEVLLNNGANVDLCTNTGESPLFVACEFGHKSIVELLLDHGAYGSFRTNTGTSPLDIANQNNHYDIVNILKSKGAF